MLGSTDELLAAAAAGAWVSSWNMRPSTLTKVASTTAIFASSSWERAWTSMCRCSTSRTSLASCSISFVSKMSRIAWTSCLSSWKSELIAAWSASTISTASSSLLVAATVRFSFVKVALRRFSCSMAVPRRMRIASECSWSITACALMSVSSFGKLARTISCSLAVSESAETFGSGDSAEAANRFRAPERLLALSPPPIATARRVRVASGTSGRAVANAPLPR